MGIEEEVYFLVQGYSSEYYLIYIYTEKFKNSHNNLKKLLFCVKSFKLLKQVKTAK